MPPKRDTKKTKIPDILWTEDSNRLIWSLLTEIEKPANYKVLFGKKDRDENTSGETKVMVYKRIGHAILPDLFAMDPNVVADRVKGKLESLTKIYRKHADRLRKTGVFLKSGTCVQYGEGVDDGEQESQEKVLDFYIPGSGPTESTPAFAVNLWTEIEEVFLFFPCLHAIFASRPNVTPICITTALGPNGRSTVWYQPPDHFIDPQLFSPAPAPPKTPCTNSQNSGTVTPSQVFGSDVTSMVNKVPASQSPPTLTPGIKNTPVQTRPPKPSTFSKDILDKARASIQAVLKK